MGGGELFQRIQEKQAFNERGKKFEFNILLVKRKNLIIFHFAAGIVTDNLMRATWLGLGKMIWEVYSLVLTIAGIFPHDCIMTLEH